MKAIKNWQRYVLEWGILAALIVFILVSHVIGGRINPDTYCPFGGIQAHASKAYHLGFGRHAAKSTLEDANTRRDYRIFEEFAYKVISEAQRCRIVDIFKLNGNVYAL